MSRPFEIDPVRQEVLTEAHTLVIKVGTQVLTDDRGNLDTQRLHHIAEQLHHIRQTGRRVALVSSGAIGAGMGRLGLSQRPKDLRYLQAAAAVGQSVLMSLYEEELARYGYHAAQLLLTAGDFDHRVRYLNVRNTLLTLFELNCIPIINENDTVSVAEIRFGDNDHLAALVTNLIQAPLLILLTVVDGVYDRDPAEPGAQLLSLIPKVDESVLQLASQSQSKLGSGGMKSKLRAARLVTLAGGCVLIANGRQPGILDTILAGHQVGTLFLPRGGVLRARQRWIGWAAQPRGRIIVDAGAREAIEKKGRSLLPVGIVRVLGNFSKGDVVAIADVNGHEFARGLTNYSANDLRRIAGLHTERIGEILGPDHYQEAIHRDNLVIIT
ncbi:MAG: glutamate 5-kinase [Gemmatales bacterium]|nr:glutamate 5-kinase [Gemmatales bacterium]MDW7994043.1 glutamate 5-kinase [Gemmatales bacterium]